MINCGTNFRHHHSTLVPLYHSCGTQSVSGLYHYPFPGQTAKRRSMPRFHVWFPRPVASHDHRWNSRSWPRKDCLAFFWGGSPTCIFISFVMIGAAQVLPMAKNVRLQRRDSEMVVNARAERPRAKNTQRVSLDNLDPEENGLKP